MDFATTKALDGVTDRVDSSLITIGIVAFNAANTIGRALRSATGQTWHRKEIIVVDDASDDETLLVVSGIPVGKLACRILRNSVNRGVAACRNRVIDEARGEYIAFFDDDDESDPERLFRQFERLRAYEQRLGEPALVVCHTARKQFYPDGTQRYEPTMGTERDRAVPHGARVAEYILTGRPLGQAKGSCATCSQMARRTVYRELHGFDESFRRSEDTELNIRLARAGGHFVGVEEALVWQHMTPTSDKRLSEECDAWLRCLEKHGDLVESTMPLRFCVDWVRAKFHYLAGDRVRFMYEMSKLALRNPVLSTRRLVWSLPNWPYNRVFKRFHRKVGAAGIA